MRLKTSIELSEFDELSLSEFETIISIYDPEDELEEDIGFIKAYRFKTLFEDEKDLLTLGINHDNQDLEKFSLAFFRSGGLFSEAKEVGFADYAFYISRVFIKPANRNKQYGLTALAAFLTLFAQGQIVACHPLPSNDLREKYSLDYGKAVMCRFWQRAGFNRYEEEDNILWTADWYPDEGMANKLAKVLN